MRILMEIRILSGETYVLPSAFNKKMKSYDLSVASTETKYIKLKTKTQKNIVIFGIFHKKNDIFILAFFF